ncbi:MAG: hypothetical protein R6V27_06500 [Balneolaceae bacterium]
MKSTNRKLISIVIATIAAGIPVSTAPSRQLDFTDPLFLATWILLGVVGSFGTYLYFNLHKRDIIGTFVVGYMVAVILRFVIEVIVINYTHSNLSISLLLAMMVGAFSGWFGSFLWDIMKKSRKKF